MRFRSLFLALLCIVLAATAFAQGSSSNPTMGAINGKVTDNTGGVLPGVTVTATNNETGLTRTSVTEGDGSYQIALIPPGRYKVVAELAGLGTATAPTVVVLLGNSTKADLSLTPQISEVVTVTAAAPVVDTTRSGIAASVTEKQIDNLPILTRDFRALATLTPGVNEAFGSRVQAGGARGIATDYNIDGANSNSEFFGEQTGGTRAPFTFSQAAIQEFQVIRSQYNAEFGRGVGATLNAITKSGTNEHRGEVFYFVRKQDWAASRPATINGVAVTESFRAKDSTQPGFAVGGPILRDRFFYFVNADFQRQELPVVAFDFSARPEFTALPEATRNAFFQRYQQLVGYPFAEDLEYATSFDQDTYLVKFDANIGSKTHASIRDNYSSFENAFNQSGSNVASNQGIENDKFNQLVGTAETIITNNLFNQLIVNYETQERPIEPTVEGFPEIQVRQGAATLTFGNINFLPNNTQEKKFQIKDSLSYVRGNHTFKGGVEGLFQNFDNFFPRFSRGQYQFATVQDFLDNRPNRFQQGLGPRPNTVFDQNTYGVFVQDSWKVMDKLTLDFGVRYDYQTMPEVTAVGAAANYPEIEENWSEDTDNIAPRFGFAYDIFGTGRSVIRGGTGLFYNYLPSILLANPLSQISGFFNQINIACTTATPCPTFPNLLTPAQFAALPAASNALQIIDDNFGAQEAWRTSLQYEQQIGRQYSVGLSGTYSQLDNVQGKRQANAMPIGYSFGNLPVYSLNNPARPYREYGSVLADFSGEEAQYQSFTIETHKLALEGSKFSWDAHYTWSESTDYESNERSTSSTFLYDPRNPSLSEGPSDFDVTHRVVLSATYELPWGILVSGIGNWRSGTPYTAGANCNCGGQSLNGLINQTGDIPVFVDRDGNIIDLTQAANLTRPQFAEFLNSRGATILGRNTERQPDVMNIDARISKTFALGRGFEIELLGEVFNVINRKNTFVTSTNQRMFTLTYNAAQDRYTAITRNSQFGVPTSYNSAVDPRQFQVAAKVRF